MIKILFWIFGFKYEEGDPKNISYPDDKPVNVIDIYAYKIDKNNEYRDSILSDYDDNFRRRFRFLKWVIIDKLKN